MKNALPLKTINFQTRCKICHKDFKKHVTKKRIDEIINHRWFKEEYNDAQNKVLFVINCYLILRGWKLIRNDSLTDERNLLQEDLAICPECRKNEATQP
jgi:hypothetical protein